MTDRAAGKRAFSEMFRKGTSVIQSGGNVLQALSCEYPGKRAEAIEISYSVQSGSYSAIARWPGIAASRREAHNLIAPALCDFDCRSVLDCGIGEATRWLDFGYQIERFFGLDASFHRMIFCRANLATIPAIRHSFLMKANMMSIPMAPKSVDAVLSTHAIEPNSETDARLIIAQMFEIARKLVIIFEPNFRDAHEAMRRRISQHGYATNIWDEAERQPGFRLIAEGRQEHNFNPDNVTSWLIFRRDPMPPDSDAED